MPELLTAYPPPPSPARTRPPERAPLRLGLVQERWHPDPEEHQEALATGIRAAAARRRLRRLPAGADAVSVLRHHPGRSTGGRGVARGAGDRADGVVRPAARGRDRCARPRLAVRARRRRRDGLGYNTAIVVAPDGRLVSRTRKLHIPVTAGYYEDHYFRPGPAEGDPFPLTTLPMQAIPPTPLSWAAPPAGTSGSRSSPAPTRWKAPRYSSIRRRSGRSPTTRTSTPSRCGSR